MLTRPAEVTAVLKGRLAKLEEAVSTPVVSGEMADWAAEAERAAGALLQVLRDALPPLRQQQFDTILAEDSTLEPRVNEMRQRDTENLTLLERLHKQLGTISQQADLRQEAETSLHDRVAKLTETGLHLVVEIRKQDTAVDTWIQEAFQRDRGVGD